MFNRLFISIILLFSISVSSSWDDLNLSLGVIDPFVNKVQTSAAGDTNKLDYKPLLEVSGQYSINEDWKILPSFGFVVPGDNDTRDDNITKLSYYLLGNLAYEIRDFSIRAGTGMYITYISGKGGTESLPNGLGVDSFPIPDESVNTRNVVLTLGGTYHFHKDVSAKLETMLFNLHTSRNKAVTYTLVATYHFHDSLWGN
tara:strand:- start:202415 stop:203014 length:600 start_codon:yes stop_codon:yes gene_type:complete